MSYERPRGLIYYYRAKRIDGRVVKEYLGGGAAAAAAAAEDEQRRSERRVQRCRDLELEKLLSDLLQEFQSYWAMSDRLLTIGLEAHHYHRRRGEWRRRREEEAK